MTLLSTSPVPQPNRRRAAATELRPDAASSGAPALSRRMREVLEANPELFAGLSEADLQAFDERLGQPLTQDPSELAKRLRCERNLLDHADEARPLAEVPVLLLADKYYRGGEQASRTTLLDLLQEPWACDAHFAQYTCDEGVRLRKDLPATGLRFELMCVDLDGVRHEAPTEAAWWRLLLTTTWITPQPNAVYRTKAGARLLYLIKPLTDPLEFEQKRLRLLAVVGRELGELSPYVLDPTRDWTRLFRAPRVVRADADGTRTDLRHMPVWVWHTDRLRLTGARWAAPAPAAPRAAASRTTRAGTGGDGVVLRYLSTQHFPGQRNDSLFKVLCWIERAHAAADAERLSERVRAHALAEGLSEIEVDAVARSARNTVAREESRDAR